MNSAPQSSAASGTSGRGGARPVVREGKERRPLSFYLFAGFFVLFVMFLYGPLSAIMLLSFQAKMARPLDAPL